MKLLDQYFNGQSIEIQLPQLLGNLFIYEFVNEYRELLNAREKIGNDFIEEIKTLRIFYIHKDDREEFEDFDLLFISYLTLLKNDFPNIEIELHFPFLKSNEKMPEYFFKLRDHRMHLHVHSGKEIFKLFSGDGEYKSKSIVRSISYIPPLIITKQSINPLFEQKKGNADFKHTLLNLFKVGDVRFPKVTDEDGIFQNIQHHFKKTRGSSSKWTPNDLSGLYFLKTLSDLHILWYLLDRSKGAEGTYQVGFTLLNEKDNRECNNKFKKDILQVLNDQKIFELSIVEIYFFSLLVANCQLFRIPLRKTSVFDKIRHLVTAQEISRLKKNEKLLKFKFIEIYKDNLERIINYTKEICYGLGELAKNIAEHTDNNFGSITGRIYDFDKILTLKSVDNLWSDQFQSNHKFLDIAVVDSGTLGIKNAYKNNITKEKIECSFFLGDDDLGKTLEKEYDSDIKEIDGFGLHHFFNFDSVRLFHQINRVKARLGLLIFSKTILNEKKGYVTLASNKLNDLKPSGYSLYERKGAIIEKPVANPLSLGTNYDFIIPVNETFELRKKTDRSKAGDSSLSSSVFLELHNYGLFEDSPIQIKKAQFIKETIPAEKYGKLDALTQMLGQPKPNELVLIDASTLEGVLQNSSDWVRFMAGIQFGSNGFHDLIVLGMELDLYLEIVAILKIFDNFDGGPLGFWKDDCRILFFIPVAYNDRCFWFNHLLCSTTYSCFLEINREINFYHLNLHRITEEENYTISGEFILKDSLLFSESGKLLNFELLLSNVENVSLFEETTYSFLHIEINGRINEN